MSRRKKITLRKFILSICSVIIGGLVFGFLPEILGGEVKTYLELHLQGNFKPILFGVLGFVVLVMLITYLYGDDETTDEKPTPTQDTRTEFLKNLRQLYTDRLKGKMMNDLHFELKLKLRYTTEGTDPQTVEDLFIIKDDAPIGDFDRLFKDYTKKLWRLLILGEPGAGKSILLLRFALRLLDMAEKDKNFPIPVLLDLASWKDPNQSFADWLEKNLPYMGGSFAVGKEEAKRLVASNALLPLLDGFDEIREEYRDSCFQQLMPYLDKLKAARLETLPEVIVCSRILEYTVAKDAPVFAALKIQPLTPADINEALRPLIKDNFIQAKRLQKALQENPALYPAISSAFFVHILLELYKQEQADFGTLDTAALQKAITQRYLQKELDNITDFPKDKTKRWLGWLAWMMKYISGRITFELIDLQPWWARKKYSFGFITGSVIGLILFLAFCTLFGLIGSVGIALLGCLFMVWSNDRIKTEEIILLNIKQVSWKIIWPYLIFGLVLGLIFGLIFVFIDMFVFGFFSGFSFGFIFGLLDSLSKSAAFPKTSQPYKRLQTQFWRDIIQWALIFCAASGVGIYSQYKSNVGFLIGILIGPFLAMLHSPLYNHFCLRLALTFEKSLPLRLVTFLDHTAARTGLLLKDGGQWRFRHQLILDELAEWFETTHPELLRPAYLEAVKKWRLEQATKRVEQAQTANDTQSHEEIND
ncbi:MAG: NACHT domain-containing protein [Saprospiraceae bacterium]|nr:NACHT domain-containing protein [Saprospiraceae bacterium]